LYHKIITITQINNTDTSIVAIAEACGFPSAKALTRTFSNYYGMSPSEYRSRIRKGEFAKLRNPISIYEDRPFTQTKHSRKNVAAFRSSEITQLLVDMANDSDFHTEFNFDK